MHSLTERRVAFAPPGFAQGGPRTLAALRIATGVAAVLTLRSLIGFVVPPAQLRFPPPGTAWLSLLPVSQGLFRVVVWIGLAAAVAVGLGWRPQLSGSMAAVAVFYAGWVTTLTGKVDHMHHVVWVLVILAVSPCANVWTVRRETRSGSADWAVTAVIVLLALIYLGSGLQKLASAGFAWGWSDNLVNTMLGMAWEKGTTVRWWLVEWPLLGRVLGLGGLVFELVFPFLLVHPSGRKWWPLGLGFHAAVWIILGISFVSLMVLYVVFLPFDRPAEASMPTLKQRRTITVLVTAVAVVSLVGLDRAWPVAAYPGFEGIRGSSRMVVMVDGEPLHTSPRAQEVGVQRIEPLARAAIAAGRPSDLTRWLGAGNVTLVTVDMASSADHARP